MTRSLSFPDLDNLGFAAARGRLADWSGVLDFTAEDLGPLLEYVLLGAAGALPKPDQAPWLSLGPLVNLYAALRRRDDRWVCPSTRHAGVFRTGRPDPEETSWLGFCLAAQKAAKANGFPPKTAAQLAASLGEIQGNIGEHSQAPRTGLLVFRARPGLFEFAAADWGIGVLASLRECAEYAGLHDHGEALRLMLTEGVSRHGAESGRGMGFRPLFTGLANLNGSLRFRSGDHALTIDGENPGTIPATLAQKVPFKGLFASIACRLS